MTFFNDPLAITRITDAETRSVSAENPDGRKGGGARAAPGDDADTHPGSAQMGRGWKVRPCLRDVAPGETRVLLDAEGPGVVQHIWCTVFRAVHPWIALEVSYDDQPHPSIRVPLGHFFANGIDGKALIDSFPIAVNPMGGMNSYWPMPFRKRIRIAMRNDGPKKIDELFYQITWSRQEIPEDCGCLHASWRRAMSTRERPEHVIADGIAGRGHYAGTYLVWNQLSNHWWGEGEVKFFLDGDPSDAPTICGTGTEDYFGGAWGFVMDHERDLKPHPYATLFLGYPQAVYGHDRKRGPLVPAHGLYRWHIADPVRFKKDLRVTVQALGWYLDTVQYQPLTDDVAATAFWYQDLPSAPVPELPPLEGRLPR